MHTTLTRSYIVVSLCIHGCILLVASFFSGVRFGGSFMVLGAHSKNNGVAYFRPMRLASSAKAPAVRTLPANAPKKSSVQKIAKPKVQQKPQQKSALTKAPSKIAPPKEQVVPKQAKDKAQELPKPEQEKVASQEQPKKEVAPKETPAAQDTHEEENAAAEHPINITMDARNYREMLRCQYEIQKEVDRLWRPPIGVPCGTECWLDVSVGSDGTIKKVAFAKRSNILIYDLSVQQIAEKFKFGRDVWNKRVTIKFVQ